MVVRELCCTNTFQLLLLSAGMFLSDAVGLIEKNIENYAQGC